MRRTIGRIANGPLNGRYVRVGQRGFAAAGVKRYEDYGK